MRLVELLDFLRYSDIRSFNLTQDKSYELKEEAYPVIGACLNRAIRKIHTDFNLRQREVIIQVRQEIDRYYLRSHHAITNDDPGYAKYLIDTRELPFRDDLVQVLRVRDEYGRDYTINTIGSPHNVMLPEYDCIEVPVDETEPALSVIYQAHCGYIDVTQKNQEIYIPTYVEEAVQLYLMYLIANTQANQVDQQKAQFLLMRYKDEIIELKNTGIVYSPTQYITTQFEEKGWK